MRSLVHALCRARGVSQVTIVSKDVGTADVFHPPVNCQAHYLRKDTLRDIVARVRLCPTYLVTYSSVLSQFARTADIVLFHNSRCGRIMATMRKAAPGKTFGILSDNVEAELKQQHRGGNPLQRAMNAIDTWLIRRAETPCRTADLMTFITESDRLLFTEHYGAPERTGILPISLPSNQRDTSSATPRETTPRILFTAHFGFAPNQSALKHFAAVAERFSKISDSPAEFVVAGARAAEIAGPYAHLKVIDSPSADEMAATFASAAVYLAPVSWGSGMKTKVAEALSYGIPVICMPNAAVGYEATLSDDRYREAICVVDNVSDMAQALHAMLEKRDLQSLGKTAFAAFEDLYSQASQTQRLELLLAS